ncbi:MAG: bacteriohemerythrin [Bacteroidales bacterium]|jgi:hemerythrin-like metal-binding protein|nr:bacteriohemerythrin [Bacteroidales bacterium]
MEKCDTISWSEELSVNEGRIDIQHKEIFEIINRFIYEKELSSRSPRLAELLSKLTDYSLIHFREEEKFMADKSFPGLAEHKKAHKYYTRKVAIFNLNYSTPNPADPDDICAFLKRWWINHILELDFEYKRYIDQSK